MNNRYEIELLHISKIYDNNIDSKTTSLNDVGIKFNPGQIHCILGPNGAGKTTLLKIIATLLEPTSGSIYINNIPRNEFSERDLILFKRQIGFLFETPFTYNLLTGYEFVSFIGEIYNVDKTNIKTRIEYYFKLFDITDWKNKYLSTYSQGMLKKIALVTTLINDQSILIFDEPTNSFDPQMIITLKELLINERDKFKTIIISTHILDIAEKLADKITIINLGKIGLTDSISVLENFEADERKSRLEKVYFNITQNRD